MEASIWDCVYKTLIYEGVTDLTYDEMKASYTDPVETLTVLGKYPGADISGISLDLVFGYIGRGIPVISRINDGRYVLMVHSAFHVAHVQVHVLLEQFQRSNPNRTLLS